ncbi:hypothetical protein [Alteromonas stellipolaris]|uniref:hypothetical protein n=1 Tax=Alteromonas stellipolaris TaxID=233316 RepID=UPI001D547E7A|nr:hypothetical protein [Alteromonas stellipolaris]MBZ2164269.1 hypothetical protein [Alteromonas stellipolaris]
MLISNDIAGHDAKPEVVTPKGLSQVKEELADVAGIAVNEVDLSQSGHDISRLYQQTLYETQNNPSPIFLTVEKRFELLKNTANEFAARSGIDYTPEQIERVTQDVGKELRIVEIPRGDVHAGGGNVYTFLSQTDKAELSEAYQYALDNDTSLDDVRHGAFALAVTRFREANIAAGVTYAIFDKEESDRLLALNRQNESEVTSTEELETSIKTLTDSFVEKLNFGNLFSSNPLLKNLMQQDSIFDYFAINDPANFNDESRDRFFNL